MDLNAVAMFTRVVQAQSFSRAALDLRVTKSTVSKKVSELEAELGTTLLRRTTRSLQLTEAGRTFYDQCALTLADLRHATENVQAASAEPTGRIRVTAPTDFASGLLAPVLAGFLESYPKVVVELVLTDRILDIINDNIDVAIRLGRLPDSSFRARSIGRDVFQLVASPQYLKARGTPKSPAELVNHDCLLFLPRPDLTTWRLKNKTTRVSITPKARLSATNNTAIKVLAAAGSGIALLPVSGCIDELAAKKLVVILPEWSFDDAPIHIVYQRDPFVSPKVKAFVDFVEAKLKPLFA